MVNFFKKQDFINKIIGGMILLKSSSKIKQIISIGLALLLFSLNVSAFAQEILLYQESESFPVTRGLTYEGRTVFTSKGWQKIHILKADLSSENIDIDTLIGKEGLSKRRAIGKMVEENGAIAGINGDFFLMATPSAPVGVQIKDGNLISSPSNRKDMAAFGLTYDHFPSIFFTQFTGRIIAPKGPTALIGGINKIGDTYNQTFVFTSEFGKTTPQIPASSPDLTFAITYGDEVVNIYDGRAAEIPENGLVLMARGAGAEFIKNNLEIGDNISLDLDIKPDMTEIKAALGGGAILVQNGVIPSSFSHNIHGVQPRTAIGFTADKSTMIMVAVDGRQSQSRGMTMQEMAKLMKDLGAHDALNLDGGGSTTMSVRPLGEKTPRVINSVSEGNQRLVANGLGIFTKALPGDVYGFKITANSFNVPKDSSRIFEVKAYDENYNPIDIDPRHIQWDVTENLGYFEQNTFYARNSGIGQITASYGDVKETQEIRVLDDIHRISIEPSKIQVNPGDKAHLTAYVIDKQGFKAPLKAEDLKWQVIGNIGDIRGFEFTASQSQGNGALVAEFDGLKAASLVQVGLSQVLLDGFESAQGKSFTSTPAEVKGSFSVVSSPEPVYDGNYSGRLDYDFTAGTGTKACYINFGQEGRALVLPSGTVKLGLWAYNEGLGHWLRGIVKDPAGREYPIDFAKDTDWHGWQWVEAVLPQGGPFILDKIYLVETNPEKNDAGTIYLDNLTAMIQGHFDDSIVPELKSPQDDANSAPIPGSIKVGAFGNTLFSKEYDPAYLSTVNTAASILSKQGTSFNFIAGKASNEGKALTSYPQAAAVKNYRTAGSDYSTYALQDTLFIFLNATKGSPRTSNFYQWPKFQQDMNTIAKNYNNIFIAIDKSPDSFTDIHEGRLFKKLLTQYKKDNQYNIWVVSGGADKFQTKMEDGIRYVNIPGVDAKEPAAVVFGISGEKITYQVHPFEAKLPTTSSIKIFVNGRVIVFDEPPYINKDERTMVPIRFVSESLGSKVNWNNKERSVTIEGNGKIIKLRIGQKSAFVNGKPINVDTKPEIKNGRTMVPLRFVSEVIGAKVNWNQDTRTIQINQ